MSIRNDFTTLGKGASGVAFTLNFVIESALFNDFLHQEALQLIENTLKVSRKYLTCQEHKHLYNRAVATGFTTAVEANQSWGYLNPWSGDSMAWIINDYGTKISNMKPGC